MKTTLITLTLIITLVSCQKQSDDVFEILQNSEHYELKQITRTEIENASTGNYSISDVLGLIAEFGQTEPDYIPQWNNYFQDASCNTAQWTFLSAPADSVFWILNGDTIRNEISLWFETPQGCGFYSPPCNGGHVCTVQVHIGGSVYERTATGYALVNNTGLPSCGIGPFEVTSAGLFSAGQPIQFEPYQFLTQTRFNYDLDGNHTVNITDLFILLSSYDNSNQNTPAASRFSR